MSRVICALFLLLALTTARAEGQPPHPPPPNQPPPNQPPPNQQPGLVPVDQKALEELSKFRPPSEELVKMMKEQEKEFEKSLKRAEEARKSTEVSSWLGRWGHLVVIA